MTDIIFKMRGDLRDILHESVVDYPSKAREKWIFDWPSQIILVVNQIFWCQEVEEAFMKLNKGQANAMKVHCNSVFACLALWCIFLHTLMHAFCLRSYAVNHLLLHLGMIASLFLTALPCHIIHADRSQSKFAGVQPVPGEAADQVD